MATGTAADAALARDLVRIERAPSRLALVGELCLLSSMLLWDLTPEASSLTVDLRGLTFIDIAGLRGVGGVVASAREAGVEVTVLAGERVERLVALLPPGTVPWDAAARPLPHLRAVDAMS